MLFLLVVKTLARQHFVVNNFPCCSHVGIDAGILDLPAAQIAEIPPIAQILEDIPLLAIEHENRLRDGIKRRRDQVDFSAGAAGHIVDFKNISSNFQLFLQNL